MEQLFWQNNRKMECSSRATALYCRGGTESVPYREAKLVLCCYGYKIGFEKRDKNKVIYLGGNRK